VAGLALSRSRHGRFSRKLVDWFAGPTIPGEVVLSAILTAVRRRRPRRTLIIQIKGRSKTTTVTVLPPVSPPCAEHGPKGQLLVRRGRGAFFGGVKKWRIKKQIYRNRELARNDVTDYIDAFHNQMLRHSRLEVSVPSSANPERARTTCPLKHGNSSTLFYEPRRSVVD
jgi:putative transposase